MIKERKLFKCIERHLKEGEAEEIKILMTPKWRQWRIGNVYVVDSGSIMSVGPSSDYGTVYRITQGHFMWYYNVSASERRKYDKMRSLLTQYGFEVPTLDIKPLDTPDHFAWLKEC